MGTSLTGLTPATTYDALIKVGDNGPLSATAKYLSDGLGNDSVLALSTSKVGVNTTSVQFQLDVNAGTSVDGINSKVNGNVIGFQIDQQNASNNALLRLKTNGHFYDLNAQSNNSLTIDYDGSTRMAITSAGNVGIGTSTPQSRLETFGASPIVTITDSNTFSSGVARTGGIEFKAFNPSANNTTQSASIYGVINPETGYTQNEGYLTFYTRAKGGSYSEKMRIQAGGGISFNGDTAAANALDDYEEGTWTMGVSFGGGSTGVTYGANTGTYTKIGRQVTVNGYLILTNKGSSTGLARITGLPYTIGSPSSNYSSASLYFDQITYTGAFIGYGVVSTTTIALEQTTTAGVTSVLTDANFGNNSNLIISLTYFV